MAITLSTPDVDSLDEVLAALREWQAEGAPMQLHPGDLGWFWQFGAEATAAAFRVWRDGSRVVALALVDGPGVLRLTTAPDLRRDEALARRLVADVSEVGLAGLADGRAAVEAPVGALLPDLLGEAGWDEDAPWTPLNRDLVPPVPDPGIRVEVVGPERAAAYAAVHRSAFRSERFAVDLWHAMATGPAFTDARSLLAYDDGGDPVAEVTVWSAGPGRPGLLEPMGVHAEHRRRGHGRAICLAAAAVLREMGASSATVCTPSSNVAGVATYLSAGYVAQPERRDRSRMLLAGAST